VALAAIDAGWAVAHPWAKQRAGWEGFVMIFTPSISAELEVVIQLVESSYSFVTGQRSARVVAITSNPDCTGWNAITACWITISKAPIRTEI